MSTHPIITTRDVYTPTCTQLLEMREKVAQQVLEEARKVQDVSLSSSTASEKAEHLVTQGFIKFEREAKQLFQVPPWSTITTMFLTTSKEKFFYSSLELLGDVKAIIVGQPMIESSESDEEGNWEWL